MTAYNYYKICSSAKGEAIEVETTDGSFLQGIVAGTDKNYLYMHLLETIGTRTGQTQFLNTKKSNAVPLAAILSLVFISPQNK